MPPHTWPARPDDQTRHPRFDGRWIRGLENMTDANLEHALLTKLGIATRNNEEGDLWHYHFCGFRQNLLPRYQRRFAAVTRRVAAWMNLPTTQALIRPKLEIFCAFPPGAALVAGNWDGPVGREPDATTGAILDSCYDCLQCMQDYGLLPGGVTGELEYNDVGFALISVALCQMGRTKATDETELPDAQSVVDFFARRVTAPGVLPFVPYTLGGGAGISSIFQLALDQESWAPAIESLANWHQRTATARPCPVVFTELGFRARWQLCKVANLRVLQWGRRHAVEISFGENPPTVPAMRHTVETCWQAVAHNPEGHLILDELLKTSPVQPNHICGTTGRNGISEAILCGRPNIVQWFLDQDRSNYEQNISERVVDASIPAGLPNEFPCSIDYAVQQWDATAAASLYMMMKYEPTLEIMAGGPDGIAGAKAGVARLALVELDGPVDEYRADAAAGVMSFAERDRNIARVREIALMKWLAALDGVGPGWKTTAHGIAMRTAMTGADYHFITRQLDVDYPHFPVTRARGLRS